MYVDQNKNAQLDALTSIGRQYDNYSYPAVCPIYFPSYIKSDFCKKEFFRVYSWIT